MSNVPPRAAQKRTEFTPAAKGTWSLIFAVAYAAAYLSLKAAVGSILIWLLGFNHGIVPLVAACGGEAGKVGFWTGFFATMFLATAAAVVKPSKHRHPEPVMLITNQSSPQPPTDKSYFG